MAEYIRITCACGRKLKAPLSCAGRKAKCPRCGGMLEIPRLSFDTSPKPDPIPEDRRAPEPEVEPPPATITFPCKRCGTSITVSKKLAGKKTLCPGCRRGIRAPLSMKLSREQHIKADIVILSISLVLAIPLLMTLGYCLGIFFALVALGAIMDLVPRLFPSSRVGEKQAKGGMARRLFESSRVKKRQVGKEFAFLTCDDYSEAPLNTWYRLARWKKPNLLVMKTKWTKDWRQYLDEEPVVGVTHEDRQANFVVMGDQPDFKIYLERERSNPVDPNAIKVMGAATVDGAKMIRSLGYLSKETAEFLGEEGELDARPQCVWLPHGDRRYGLRIRVLSRSVSYRKRKAKSTE